MMKILFIVFILLFSICGIAFSAAQLLPDELMEVAKKNDCTPIDDFYLRPGMVNPPYVYGYLPGPEEKSAVFWCKKSENNNEKYLLVFMLKEKRHESAKCTNKIEWSNYPGGLTIYNNPSMTLENFVYMNDPRKKILKNVKLEHNAVLSEYDGASELFYCYKGEWALLQRH